MTTAANGTSRTIFANNYRVKGSRDYRFVAAAVFVLTMTTGTLRTTSSQEVFIRVTGFAV